LCIYIAWKDESGKTLKTSKNQGKPKGKEKKKRKGSRRKMLKETAKRGSAVDQIVLQTLIVEREGRTAEKVKAVSRTINARGARVRRRKPAVNENLKDSCGRPC